MAESRFVRVTADLLREGYSVRFQAKGASMYPTIEDGKKVVVEPVAPSQIKRGDIILYRRHEGMIAHRVVRIARTEQRGRSPQHCFILRGDASDSCDEPVESERILGKVVAVEQCDRSIALDGMGAKIFHILRSYGARFKRWIAPSGPPGSIKRARSTVGNEGANVLPMFDRITPQTRRGEGDD